MTSSIESFLTEWAAAERAGDSDQLGILLDDDFVGIGPLGFSLTKAEWVARHRQGLVYQEFGLEEVGIRSYGDLAVVIARDVQQGSYHGNQVPEAVRATHILVHKADGWHLAGLQMSFIAGTPGAPPVPGGPATQR